MTAAAAPSQPKKPAKFEAPHPGSQQMPRWDTGELIDAPRFKWRNVLALIGPGLVMGAAAIGGGEWLAGPEVTAKYGGSLLWVAAISILVQVLYNIEISRYTLYTGEPIFTGKFRTLPGPLFWLGIYLLLDWGAVFPYLATGAAVALETIIVGHPPGELEKGTGSWWLHKVVSTLIYLTAMTPLIFGGKVYNSLKAVMSFKLVTVLGFLIIVGLFYTRPSTWWEITSGFAKVGNVPVKRGEDANGNGTLDPGEDFDGDGRLDGIEPGLPKTVDTNGDGKPDDWAKDAKGNRIKFEDKDGDGIQDGFNVDNVFLQLAEKGTLPKVDWSLIAVIAGLAAIAGNGGLTNTPISNFTRDQGWGMGHHVGAIPSMVGGQGITLSHVGRVFEVNEESLPRWRRWYNHVVRDQTLAWMMACFIGVALPSILSVEFLPRGTSSNGWDMAAMTAGKVAEKVGSPQEGVLATEIGLTSFFSGPRVGAMFWFGTLFCGFLTLITSMASTIDGFVRRWVDVVWTASSAARAMDDSAIRYLYFAVFVGYCTCGLTLVWVTEKPGWIFQVATCGYNFAFAISAWHTLFINTYLLPKELRPNWLIRVGLVIGGCFFVCLGVMSALKLLGIIT